MLKQNETLLIPNYCSQELGSDAVLQSLMELLDDQAFFIVDEQRTVVHWSAGAEKLLGFLSKDVLGKNCLAVNRCMQCMKGCGISEYGLVRNIPLRYFDAAGNEVFIKKTGKAFFDDEGKFLGGVELLVPDTLSSKSSLPVFKESPAHFHGIVSENAQMKQVFRTISNVAETHVHVLIRGESGTGKELVARALHKESRSASGPFVAINCAALTASIAQSELFGHVKGAFTGAISDKEGYFEQADGGTIFLDEVAELSLEMQAKLLRVLEDHVIQKVGSKKSQHVDVRVVAATHRSLKQLVQQGKFREDLMYRLRVVPIFLPPLRDRIEDLESLCWYFIRELNERGPRHVSAISPSVLRLFFDYGWPGNIRELRNVIQYAFAVGRGEELVEDDLPQDFFRLREMQQGEMPSSLRTPNEVTQIKEALALSKGHIGKACEILGMSRSTFWRKRKYYNM